METSSVVGSYTTTWYLNINLFQAAFKKLFERLKNFSTLSIEMKNRDGLMVCSFAVILSYCCEVPEWNDICNVRHALLLGISCIRCIGSQNDVKGLQMTMGRPKQDIESVGEVFTECIKNFISTGVIRKRRLV